MKFQGTELERQMALCNLTTSVATLGLEFDKKFFQEAIETISFIEKRIRSVTNDEKLVELWNVKGKEYKAWLDKAVTLLKENLRSATIA